ncbi:hypothetical protein H0H93_013010 [Arthromyces matolae]|nr:hypothetical protein H0H93_013010 [Arthromyces matolae]
MIHLALPRVKTFQLEPSPAPAPAVPTSRTTRARTATAKPTTSELVGTTAKKTTTRKPLVSRENTTDSTKAPPKSVNRKATSKQSNVIVSDTERQPIMAFLRIRPNLGNDGPTVQPYLTPLSDTAVRMVDPNEQQDKPARFRPSVLPPSSTYTFSHVFPPDTTQSDFFVKTTLPLVRDVLHGQNGLLFTYGVTNSGKTYTVQGGTQIGSAGILPRALDVIFNSIDGLHGDGRFRPVRLQGVEPAHPSDSKPPPVAPEPTLAEVFGQHMDISASDTDIDPTNLKVDRNYEYTIWLSYAEVYNEKIYDLLDSVKDNGDAISRPTAVKSMVLTRAALPLKPSPASDNGDSVAGKYISGLRQFRVHSTSQAKALVRLGQLHRRVFGTLANSESSRSHGVVIIKVVRGHRGEKNDPTALQVSRLTLVDLAGSERTKHTHTTGDRLREAGNINKSLMAMIVNVNPYDTGYDENSHVMRFAALAREVYVNPAPAPILKMKGPGKIAGMSIKALGPLTLNDPEIIPFNPSRRKVTISMGGQGGKQTSEAIVEVLEEDEPNDDQEEGSNDDDEPINPLVDALFDEVENLRMQLFESEMRCAIIEAETREEVMHEMEERMRAIEERYSRRLMKELEQNELKTDAKIDMLHQSGLFGSPMKRQVVRPPLDEVSDEEAEVENSLVEYDQSESELEDELGTFSSKSIRSPSMSPLAEKSKNRPQPFHNEKAELSENEHESVTAHDTSCSEDADDDDDEWVPRSTSSRSKAPRSESDQAVSNSQMRIDKLAQDVDQLTLDEADESVMTVPAKKNNKSASPDEEDAKPSLVKKRKRQLGKRIVMTEEQIEKTTTVVERNAAKTIGGKSIRRLI